MIYWYFFFNYLTDSSKYNFVNFKSPFNGWDNPIVGDEDSGVGWSGVRPMEEPKEE